MVGSPCVQSTSFKATGSPASRPTGLPALRRRSISSACAKAAAGSTLKNAFTLAVNPLDAVQIRLRKLNRSDFALGESADQFHGVLMGHRRMSIDSQIDNLTIAGGQRPAEGASHCQQCRHSLSNGQ